MATTLKTKNSVTTTVVPTTLAQGELAVNITDKKMWVGNAATTPVQILGAGATNRAGGSNTQVQYNSSGDLAGSANFVFDGTNVGIGNSSPNTRLDVYASNPTNGQICLFRNSAASSQNGTYTRYSQNGIADWIIGQPAAVSAFTFGTTASEYMRIDSSGNVNISCTTGRGGLNLATANGIAIGDASAPTDVNGRFYISYIQSANTGFINLYKNGTYGQLSIDGAPLIFTSSSNEKMRMDASGNFFVGVTSNSGVSAGSIVSNGSLLVKNPLASHQTSCGVLQYTNNETSIRSYGATAGTGVIVFNTGGGGGSADAEAMRINTNGNIALKGASQTSTGVGISFPATQSASNDANCLDDYEEGTWTPTITFNGNSVGITYNTTFTGATYTKIGNRVCISGYVLLTNKGSSSGDASISNLPFTSQVGNTKYVAATIGGSGFTFANQFWGRIAPNNVSIDLFETTTGGTITAITNADFTNGAEVYFSATYTV